MTACLNFPVCPGGAGAYLGERKTLPIISGMNCILAHTMAWVELNKRVKARTISKTACLITKGLT